jgi:hypothetical protein
MDKNTVTQNATKGQDEQIIHQFIQGLVDSRKREYKRLKETNLLCRKLIEVRISETPDVNRLLFKYQDDPWIKKILINYTILQMCHHAALWDVDDLQPKKIKGFNIESVISKE